MVLLCDSELSAIFYHMIFQNFKVFVDNQASLVDRG